MNDLITIQITLINTSSAFIERYFSICVVKNTDRNHTIKHDFIEIYAFLTSNMHKLHTFRHNKLKLVNAIN